MDIQTPLLNAPLLQRFIEAQDKCYKEVVKELSLGRKTTHWIWYIFPQVYGLGFSQRSRYYGIHGLDEAKAYWANALLRDRYIELLDLLLSTEDRPENILGVVDAKKLQSSITLFLEVDPSSDLLNAALEKLFFGKLDNKTIEILTEV
jgi:uncharacterized protein (DUF1810 family)